MNFSVPLNWFQAAVGYPVTLEEIEARTGDMGFDIQIHPSPYQELRVVIAKVIETKPHPNAERLSICQVDDGSGGPLVQIVCGCPSVREGITVPLAKVGAVLPSVTIKESVIRGVESKGMLCSRADLGLERESSGLWRLSDDYAAGVPIFSVLEYNSPLLIFEVTPNRRDCLSLEGIAREWSTIIKKKYLELPRRSVLNTITVPKTTMTLPSFAAAGYWVKVKIDQPIQLPEAWVQRLQVLGLYSSDPVLNLQRLAEVEFGLPLHIYSNQLGPLWTLELLKEDCLWTGLDGVEYSLKVGDAVVCNDGKPVALAGALGDYEHRYQSSSEFWIEAIELESQSVHAVRKRLGLLTTASLRFSRGVAPGLAEHTLSGLLGYLQALPGVSVEDLVYAQSPETGNKLSLKKQSVVRLLGFDPKEQLEVALENLGFQPTALDSSTLSIHVPWYRSDIEEECDIIEEVIRAIGYDALQESMPDLPVLMNEQSSLRDQIDDYLVVSGFDEVISYSFVEQHWDQAMGLDPKDSLKLANPISADLSVMRRSLMPSLLKISHYRNNNQQPYAMLYEWGRTYSIVNDAPSEHEVLALLISGDRWEDSPLQPKRAMDYYDLLSRVQALFTWLGLPLLVKQGHFDSHIFHPKVIATLWSNDVLVGHIGMVHPKFSEGHPHAFYGEISVGFLAEMEFVPLFKEFQRYPDIYRDLSLWCPLELTYASVDQFLREFDLPELKSWALVDSYYAQGAIQRQSISLRLCLSGKQKSLKDADVERVISKLLSKMSEKLLVELRKNENVNEG